MNLALKGLRTNPIQNFIPWRAVWNSNSVSTLCCLIFDVSQETSSGASPNDLLAKGKNNMSNLLEIVNRLYSREIGFRTGIKKDV